MEHSGRIYKGEGMRQRFVHRGCRVIPKPHDKWAVVTPTMNEIKFCTVDRAKRWIDNEGWVK
jgi:hypothetical protein